MLYYFFKSNSQNITLAKDDLAEFKTYVIYWKSADSAQADASEIVKGSKKGKDLLEVHIRVNGVERCVYDSLDAAMDQLSLESKCPESGAYLFCIREACELDGNITGARGLVIEKAVDYASYASYKRHLRGMNDVCVIAKIMPPSSFKI